MRRLYTEDAPTGSVVAGVNGWGIWCKYSKTFSLEVTTNHPSRFVKSSRMHRRYVACTPSRTPRLKRHIYMDSRKKNHVKNASGEISLLSRLLCCFLHILLIIYAFSYVHFWHAVSFWIALRQCDPNVAQLPRQRWKYTWKVTSWTKLGVNFFLKYFPFACMHSLAGVQNFHVNVGQSNAIVEAICDAHRHCRQAIKRRKYDLQYSLIFSREIGLFWPAQY